MGGSQHATRQTRLLCGLHGEAQTERRQNCTQRVESRVAPFRQCAIQRLAAQSSFLSQGAHSAQSVRNCTKGDRYCTGITVG
jgi:hypothetical protein